MASDKKKVFETKENVAKTDNTYQFSLKETAKNLAIISGVVIPDAIILWFICTAIKGTALQGIELLFFGLGIVGIGAVATLALALCKSAGDDYIPLPEQ